MLLVPVLGIPHPAVATRDVALYQPFRNALRSPNQVIGLQTLMWHLMCRRCQDGQLHPVSSYHYPSPSHTYKNVLGRECPCRTRLVSDGFDGMGRGYCHWKLAVVPSSQHFLALLPLIFFSRPFTVFLHLALSFAGISYLDAVNAYFTFSYASR